jgi:hypothetical protein
MNLPDTSLRKNRFRYFVWILGAATLILAIIFGLVALGYLSGRSLGEECRFCADTPTDSAPAIRTGPDSVRIVMQPDTLIHHDQAPTVKIYLDERDASNQSLIAASGLDAIISPPEGLVFSSGSSVTLRGSAVSGNKTAPVHLQIIATYPDTGRRVVIGEQLF